MDNIKVKLLHHTPLEIATKAIRTCWDSTSKGCTVGDNIGREDAGLLERIVKKHKHLSTIEHIHYNFFISGISRGCLQELARHRMASYSVESTRYTLKKHLSSEKDFNINDLESKERAKKYIVMVDEDSINNINILQLNILRDNCKKYGNDITKYILPECFRTKLYWTINARSLRNFLELRGAKLAHFEIRKLAELIHKGLPEEHKLNLFSDIMP